MKHFNVATMFDRERLRRQDVAYANASRATLSGTVMTHVLLTDYWEYKYANARQYNRNLEQRNQKLKAALLSANADLREVWIKTGEGLEALKRTEVALGLTKETASKQPDEYAAHSPECYLRKYREGYCDCELPAKTKPGQAETMKLEDLL